MYLQWQWSSNPDVRRIDESDSNTNSRPKPQSRSSPTTFEDSNPPHDFRGAMEDGTGETSSGVKLPGKDKKGNVYDPAPSGDKRDSKGSWDDSDAEEKTLAQLRANFEKNKPKAASADIRQEPKGADEEPKASSWKNLGKNKSKGQKKDKGSKSKSTPPKSSKAAAADENMSSAAILKPSEKAPSSERLEFMDNENHDDVLQHTKNIYYFDEENTRYLQARLQDRRPIATLEGIADKAEFYMKRGWREFFGVLRIIIGFFIIFVVELFKFLIQYIIRPVFIGFVSTFGDYVLKPLLAAVYNGLILPFLMLAYNIATGFRTVVKPLIDVIRALGSTIADILRAFRLVEVNMVRHGYEPVVHTYSKGGAIEDV